MREDIINMETVFSIKDWEAVQDSLAKTSGMPIIMVDYKGTPLSKHSMCSEFCIRIRSDEVLGKYCEKCDSRGGAEAVRENKPYIYKCCFGLIDVAIPIVFKNTYLGSVLIGQVKCDDVDVEKILTLPINKSIVERLEKYIDSYNKIKTMSFDKINIVAYMLYDICNYIVARENINIKSNEKSISNQESSKIKGNKIIIKAKQYIEDNFENNISLNELADYCNVSSSYLSRLFVKETGESFSHYITKTKMDMAKEWLENSDMSISEIGYSLGFNETGYFIRSFKKFVGMTPGVYRKYRNNIME
ncbi:MAG: PocR ligand-binding domain-containing protein [Tyzzerella sp.]|uniref:PocR ligand-binding domain-containing protein n=1 Tax=Candidatus Fimicola merdigallinarum TaxID=2840819 RepID=A0A9D9DU93_9FIRM|nr:PocR ligand-binding domain-containing protein [Candidatus Fimicola merdigallinarum]